jgi:hypothetical protein
LYLDEIFSIIGVFKVELSDVFVAYWLELNGIEGHWLTSYFDSNVLIEFWVSGSPSAASGSVVVAE